MRAVVITEPGGPEVLRWLDVPDPVPGPGDVLIEVAASGVNRADLMQREGHYPPPEGAPPYPGLECSGRVIAVGDEVTAWRPGDEVCALLSGGGYAEQVVVPAGQLLPIPAKVDLTQAAAFPEAVCTVYSNLFQVACTAGSAQKLARCRELGADVTINYRDEDFVAALRDATDGAGAAVAKA